MTYVPISRSRLLVSAGLRMTTLVCRFSLIFVLARYLSIESVGFYGLLASSVSYVLFPLGFDFYTYATRQVIGKGPEQWPMMVVSQLAFAAAIALVLFPLCTLIFAFDVLPWRFAGWFFALVALDYLCLEADRFLVAAGRQLDASIGLFLGGAMAPLSCIVLLPLVPALRSLDFVMAMWIMCDVVAVAYASQRIRSYTRGGERARIDWQWVRVGIRVSSKFLVGTMCLRALFAFDRQIVKVAEDAAVLAAYTFYMSTAAGLTAVIHAGVHQFLYPGMVRAAHEEDWSLFRRLLGKLLVQTVLVAVVVSAGFLIAKPILLEFVGDQVYERYDWLLPACLAAMIVYNVSLVPHYGLYALGADREIVGTTVFSFGVFVVVVAATVRFGAASSVVGAIAAAGAFLLVSKSWLLRDRLRVRMATVKEQV